MLEANDVDSDFAIGIAELWQRLAPGHEWCEAEVTSYHGMTLTSTTGTQLHFTNVSCGFNGEGPRAAAAILEIFGFGESSTILNRIRHGGDNARYNFHHPIHTPAVDTD
jgi:hypothetical protein